MAATPQLTITGKLLLLSGQPNVGSVVFELENFGNNMPVVEGTCIVTTTSTTVKPDENGFFSVQLWGNDVISPDGSYYVVSYFSDTGNLMGTVSYQFTGSGTVDLSGVMPIQTSDPLFPKQVVLLNPDGEQTISDFKLHVTEGMVTSTLEGINGQPVSFPNGLSTPSMGGLTEALEIPGGVNTPSIEGLVAPFRVDQGGTGSNLTNTGGSGMYLKQTSKGAPVTVGNIQVSDIPVFKPSGSNHAAGLVPDPGATAGTGRYLREDGQWYRPEGSGTVTSVGLVMPSWYRTSGVVTDAGSISVYPDPSQPKNMVIATPNGSVGPIGLRALVWADMPSAPLTVNQGGTGSDLSQTGGAGQFLKQISKGGNVGVAVIAPADLPVFKGSGNDHAAGIVPDAGSTPGTTRYLREDGQWIAPAGSGTVTSINLATPGWLTVSGGPITSAGTLAISATPSQGQNQFLATPNGQDGAVGLRAIGLSDLPTINSTKVDSSIATAKGSQILANKTFVAPSNPNNLSLLNVQGQTVNTNGDGTRKLLYSYRVPANTMHFPSAIRVSCSVVHNATQTGSWVLQGGTYVWVLDPARPATYTLDFGGTTLGTLTTINNVDSLTWTYVLVNASSGQCVTTGNMGSSVSNVSSFINQDQVINVYGNVPNGDSVAGMVFMVEFVQ